MSVPAHAPRCPVSTHVEGVTENRRAGGDTAGLQPRGAAGWGEGGGFPTPACLPPLTQTALKEGGCHKPPASTAAPQGEEEDEAVAGGGSAARCLRRRRRTFSNRGGGRVKGGGRRCVRA